MSHGKMRVDASNKVVGTVCTRAIYQEYWLVSNTERRGDKSPSHIIMGLAPAGHEFQAGLAYEYQITKGDASGRTGFHLLFNDPDFGEGLWFSAFPEGNNIWNVSMNRDKEQKAAA